ncbi:MAG: hypothetical protein ABJA67_08005 [Chthonomonadales bacterium]
MMLVHIPQGGGKATAVSLPRDTWIGPKVMKSIRWTTTRFSIVNRHLATPLRT